MPILLVIALVAGGILAYRVAVGLAGSTSNKTSPVSPPSPKASGTADRVPETNAPPRADDGWDPKWLTGSHNGWTIDPDPNATKTDFAVATNRVLMRYSVIPGSDVILTGFDVRTGAPVEKWTQHLAFNPEETRIQHWKDWFIIGTTLVNVETGELASTPWGADETLSADDDLITCSKDDSCSYWETLDEPKWTRTISSDISRSFRLNEVVEFQEGRFLPVNGIGGINIVDLATGEVKSIDDDRTFSHINAARDGWVLSGIGTGYAFFKPDGTHIATLAGLAIAGSLTEVPWERGGMSLHQVAQWVDNGDLSWADSRITAVQDEKCQSISVNGGDPIDLAGGSAFVLSGDDTGRCAFDLGFELFIDNAAPVLEYGLASMTIVDHSTGEHNQIRIRGPHAQTLSDLEIVMSDRSGRISTLVAGSG